MVRLHLEQPQAINTICILLAACFLGCTTIAHLTQLLFRNWSLPTAQVEKHRGAVKLIFNLSRPWKLRAGQYIYLKVPGLGFRSSWQSLPLYLIWWEVGPEDGVVTVTVLMKVQTGFTRALYLTPHRYLRVLVDGPYGGPRLKDQWEEMQAYDSVTLLATDIGISGQLPYVRDLLRYFIAEQNGRGTRKRISLIWEVKEECESQKSAPFFGRQADNAQAIKIGFVIGWTGCWLRMTRHWLVLSQALKTPHTDLWS